MPFRGSAIVLRAMSGDTPDSSLVARARDGDRAAFEELTRRHASRIHGVVRRLGASQDEADEITQEAFLRAWRGIAGFNGDSQFFTWLCSIAINESRREIRRRLSRGTLLSLDKDGAQEPPDPSADPYRSTASTELRHRLEDAVRGLPVKYRAPLILRDVEGLTTEDAAAVLGLSESAFKSRLHRARRAVQMALDDYPARADS